MGEIEVPKRFIGTAMTQECKWQRARIREAVDAWAPLVEESVIVVAREAFDVSASDDEVEASLRKIPDWLS